MHIYFLVYSENFIHSLFFYYVYCVHCCMCSLITGWGCGWIDGSMGGWMDEWVGGCGWVDGWVEDEWMDG